MKFLKLVPLALMVFLLSSCKKEKADPAPAPITINDFVGSWKANSAIFTNNSDPAQQFSFIANGGEIRFTMLNGGGTRIWVDIGTFSDEWDAQVVLNNDNTVTSTPVEATRDVETSSYVFGNNKQTLTLTNNNAKFDFTLTGAPTVSAKSVIIYTRQ